MGISHWRSTALWLAIAVIASIILPGLLAGLAILGASWFFGSHVLYSVGHLLSRAINHTWTPEQLDVHLHAIYQKIMGVSLWINERTGHGPWL